MLAPKIISIIRHIVPEKLKISENGINLIKRFEGLRLKAYYCEAGILTIGWGSTKGVKYGMTITTDEAERLLLRDISAFEKAVRSLIRVNLNQNQFDALVSFTFNCGTTAFEVSTLRKLLNKSEYEKVPEQMLRWCKVKKYGKHMVSNGLLRRRRIEAELFMRE